MKPIDYYLRTRFMPHIWCPGCGHGTVLNGLIRSVDDLGLRKNEIVMVSGIGCSARIAGYLDFHTLHTLHGRALAFATGVKLSRPDLTILVPMGDGDALAIGGNHFIHAARRNIDITVIILNNRIYGMTGGQFSPTSGCGIEATTAPYSSVDPPFDAVNLAKAAGATFVARTTTYHVKELERVLTKAIQHHGFSVVEVLSQCPTHFGRRNGTPETVEMLTQFKERTATVGSKKLEESDEMIPRGIFVDEQRPEYCDQYADVVKRAQETYNRSNRGRAPGRDTTSDRPPAPMGDSSGSGRSQEKNAPESTGSPRRGDPHDGSTSTGHRSSSDVDTGDHHDGGTA